MAARFQHPYIFREGAQGIGCVMGHAVREDRIARVVAQRQPEIGRGDVGGIRRAASREQQRGETDIDRDHCEAAPRQIEDSAAGAAANLRNALTRAGETRRQTGEMAGAAIPRFVPRLRRSKTRRDVVVMACGPRLQPGRAALVHRVPVIHVFYRRNVRSIASSVPRAARFQETRATASRLDLPVR